jgi:hypothetical protein
MPSQGFFSFSQTQLFSGHVHSGHVNPGHTIFLSSCKAIVVLFAVLPMISSSTGPAPYGAIFVLSVLLPMMSTTTDPELPNAQALGANVISIKAKIIDILKSYPLHHSPYLT